MILNATSKSVHGVCTPESKALVDHNKSSSAITNSQRPAKTPIIAYADRHDATHHDGCAPYSIFIVKSHWQCECWEPARFIWPHDEANYYLAVTYGPFMQSEKISYINSWGDVRSWFNNWGFEIENLGMHPTHIIGWISAVICLAYADFGPGRATLFTYAELGILPRLVVRIVHRVLCFNFGKSVRSPTNLLFLRSYHFLAFISTYERAHDVHWDTYISPHYE